MERGEGVLAHGLDGHRKNLLVPVSLEQSFGVRAALLHRSWLSAKSTYGGGRGNVRP